jgi:WD40 repeat protein
LPTKGEPTVIELPLPIAPASLEAARLPTLTREHLVWSPTEPTLAVVCSNSAGKGVILFWDTARQAEKARWEGDFDPKHLALAFHPAGQRLAAGDSSGSVRVYHIADQRETLRLEAVHTGGVSLLRWSAEDRLLSAGPIGNTFREWELSEGDLRATVVPGKKDVDTFAFSPDGKWLALQYSKPKAQVALLNRQTGALQPAFATVAGRGTLLFRPGGQQLALVRNVSAYVWDLETGKLVVHRWQGGPAVFLEDGRLLTTDTVKAADKQVRLVVRDILSGQEVGPGIVLRGSDGLAGPGIMGSLLSADGRLVFSFLGSKAPSAEPIQVWEVASGKQLGELKPPGEPVSCIAPTVYPSPDGQWLFQFRMPFSYDAGAKTSELLLTLWHVPSGRCCWETRAAAAPANAAFSPDGRLLAVGYENGIVELRETETGEELFRWQPHGAKPVKHLAFTPDGAHLATSDGQTPLHLLHLAELRRQLEKMGLGW